MISRQMELSSVEGSNFITSAWKPGWNEKTSNRSGGTSKAWGTCEVTGNQPGPTGQTSKMTRNPEKNLILLGGTSWQGGYRGVGNLSWVWGP